jgi:ribosomal protein L37AE/L43A
MAAEGLRLADANIAKGDEMIARPNTDNPHCPSCGKPMQLTRTILKSGDLPELRSWECKGCGVHFTGEHTLPI